MTDFVTSVGRNGTTQPVEESETLEAFLARLERIATDWRYSHEFIGLIVRSRWPKKYHEDRAYPQRDWR